MSPAFKIRCWNWESSGPDDDNDDCDDDDDELFDELLELLDELLEREDEAELADDGLEVAATLFFLASSRVSRTAAITMTATASTPTMIHFALLEAAPGAPGGGPAGRVGGPPPGGGPGGTGGIADVGGGSAAAIDWVAPAGKSGCCSGGYHLPSDACHQPSPWPVSLMHRHCRQSQN